MSVMNTEPQLADSQAEMAIRSLYRQLMEGWNAGSAAAFAAPFAVDGDLVAFDGTHFKGRSAIIAFHQPLFDRWLKGTRLVGSVHQVRFLGPDIAVMHASGGTVLRGKTKADPVRDSIQTLVARRTSDGWQLAAFQNTRRRPMSDSVAAVLLWNVTDWLWSLLRRR